MALCHHCGHDLDAHILANRGRATEVMGSAEIQKGHRCTLHSCPWYRIVDAVRMRYYASLERAAEARRHFEEIA